MARAVFPKAGRFQIKSNPIFLVKKGRDTEIVVFDAVMKIRTAAPKRTQKGSRRVAIEVDSWKARAQSKLLGPVGFNIKPKTKGRGSVLARRGQRGDFPATLRFTMDWEASTKMGTVTGLSGVAIGKINSFPPKSDDLFEIRGKEISVGRIKIIPIVCAC